MNKLKDEILQKLQNLLRDKESIPIRDAANIIRPDGVTAIEAAQAIKECIKIVKECKV